MHLSQHQLCARNMEAALVVKFQLDFHQLYMAMTNTTLTNGSDLNTYFRSALLQGTYCMYGCSCTVGVVQEIIHPSTPPHRDPTPTPFHFLRIFQGENISDFWNFPVH